MSSITYGSDDFVEAMKGAELKAHPPDGASEKTTDEFGRFAELTQKLVKVSKEELDEKRKDEASASGC